MKKLLGIMVLGLLWCNVGVAATIIYGYAKHHGTNKVYEGWGTFKHDAEYNALQNCRVSTWDKNPDKCKIISPQEASKTKKNIQGVKYTHQAVVKHFYSGNTYTYKGIKRTKGHSHDIDIRTAINKCKKSEPENKDACLLEKVISERYVNDKFVHRAETSHWDISVENFKKEEEKIIAKEKDDYERLEAKHRKKCKKAFMNPKGFEIGTPEYKKCIQDTENKEIAKSKEEEKEIAQENKLTEIDPDLIPIASGSGFFVSREGHIITNEHVAGICELLAIKVGGKKKYFNVVTTDKVNDLGLLKGNYKHPKYLEIDIEGPNLGEEIVTMGYPLGDYTGAGVKITKGIVSSLSGPGNNYSEFQIDAAIGPGSSGGPVINKSAQVVGVAYGGINKMKAIKEQEHIPENINFAISSQTLTNFLKANKVNYTKAYRDKKLDTEAIAQIGDAATVQLYCLNTEDFYIALREAESHTDILLDLE